jgi:Zn-dependent membrane protease YugP
MYFDPYYLLYIAPAILLGLFAQIRVTSAFNKYSKVNAQRGLTGKDAARAILDRNGLYNVDIRRIAGELTDNFDPRSNVINLSTPVYDSHSIAAIGVAAHEAGHAVQHQTGYWFIKVRAAIIPVCNIGASISPLLILLGFFLNMVELYWLGIILFGTVAVFQLVTLPVEFNASKRAIAILETNGTLTQEELKGARAVLSAAALTYVAALLTSLLQLFYYLSLSNRRK